MRSGRFRIVAQEATYLVQECERLTPEFQALLALRREGRVVDADVAAQTVRVFYNHRLGSVRRAKLNRPLFAQEPPFEVARDLNLHSWMGLSLRVNRSLVRWALGDERYVLTNEVPDSMRMLEMQCQGKRFISLCIAPADLVRWHEGKFDSYGLLLHDLIHAERFFEDPAIFRCQVGFYRRLRDFLATDVGARLLAGQRELMEYLGSDMNAHPLHLMRYFFGMVRRSSLSASDRESVHDWWRREVWSGCGVDDEFDEVVRFKAKCSDRVVRPVMDRLGEVGDAYGS